MESENRLKKTIETNKSVETNRKIEIHQPEEKDLPEGTEEIELLTIQTNRTNRRNIDRPFPLKWGLAALLVFAIFAVVTQLQFSRISNDKIFQARMDTYQSDLRAYDVAVAAYDNCLILIDAREVYRDVFTGIAEIFNKAADLPLNLGVDVEFGVAYQTELRADVEERITVPVRDKLPPLQVEQCPQLPASPPVKPVR